MCSVVDSKSELMPEARKWYGTGNIPSRREQVDERAKEQAVAQTLDSIRAIVAIVKSLCLDSLLKLSILLCDVVLRLVVQGWIFRSIEIQFLLSPSI